MAADQVSAIRYRFGAYTLDLERGELLEKDRALDLRPQSFQVLKILVEHHGRLVTRDEIHEQVWGSRAVTDDSLAQCLTDIRKALGDRERTLIRTVPRRGFIFEGEVRAEAGRRGPGRVQLAAAAVLLLVALLGLYRLEFMSGEAAGRQVLPGSVAVLPFIDLTRDQQDQYLGYGLAEEIIHDLSQSRSLQVIARTSSFAFSSAGSDIETIRDALGVAYIVEGSLRRQGDELVVTVQLIDTSTGTHIASKQYSIPPGRLSRTQPIISADLYAALVPESEPLAGASGLPEDASAADLMLLARDYERRARERADLPAELLGRSIELYRKAVAAAPDSALANARLGRALLYAGEWQAAYVAIERALLLDENQSEVQEVRGRYLWLHEDPLAGEAWLRAMELNPSNADAISSYAYWHWFQGGTAGFEETFPPNHERLRALFQAQQFSRFVSDEKPVDTGNPEELLLKAALSLDPLALSRYADLGSYYGHESLVEPALEVVDEVRSRFDSPESFRVIARLLDIVGQTNEAIAWTMKAMQAEPGNPTHRAALSELLADIGAEELALQADTEPGVGILIKLRRYQDVIEEGELLVLDYADDVQLRYLLGFAYLAVDRPADAVRRLRSAGLDADMPWVARQSSDVEARVTFADALQAAGEDGTARALSEHFVLRRGTDTRNWWIHLYLACSFAILDRDREALAEIALVAESPRLPWAFLLQDSRCFRRYSDEPVYRAVVDRVEQRRAALRRELPAVLARHGLSLRIL